MLMLCFFAHKSLLELFGVLCLLGAQKHLVVQLLINPLARCICPTGYLRQGASPWN